MLTHFSDGAILMRPIRGVFQITYYDQFRPVFGTPEPIIHAPSTTETTAGSLNYRFTSEPAPSTTTGMPSMVKSYRYPLKGDETRAGVIREAKGGAGKNGEYALVGSGEVWRVKPTLIMVMCGILLSML